MNKANAKRKIGAMGATGTLVRAVAFLESNTWAPPQMHEHVGIIFVGADWMREHLPASWATWCAARLLGAEMQLSVATWSDIVQSVLEEHGWKAKDEVIATRCIEMMCEYIGDRMQPMPVVKAPRKWPSAG